MKRVYIVGGSGYGKDDLARCIAADLGVEPFGLYTNSKVDRASLAAGERWVVEGIPV